ncbi:hypothetical protein PINS_up004470 [Pythium insidiosum]|nr:hypothetical protein PINS_up004470 [Pythium insidiosum]
MQLPLVVAHQHGESSFAPAPVWQYEPLNPRPLLLEPMEKSCVKVEEMHEDSHAIKPLPYQPGDPWCLNGFDTVEWHEDLLWLQSVLLDALTTDPKRHGQVTKSRRSRWTAEELESRRQHRRSMQKGYEQGYRQRKKISREALREEWMQLEQDLHKQLRSAQTKAMVWRRTVPPSLGAVERMTALAAESHALSVERTLLRYLLRSEDQLAEARGYFTQSCLREKVNELSSSPAIFRFRFEWD